MRAPRMVRFLCFAALLACEANPDSTPEREAGTEDEADDAGAGDDEPAEDMDAGDTADAARDDGARDAGSQAQRDAMMGGAGDTLSERIDTSTLALPAGIKPGVRNYRVFSQPMFKVAPLFTVPLADCGTLIGLTTNTVSTPHAYALRLDANDKVVATLDLGAILELRGLAAEPDGHFAALLWNGISDQIWVKRYDLSGKELYATELTNKVNGMIDNSPTDFGIGEARLTYGAGKYGAYYHVHSASGHEGDTLKFVAAATGVESTTWAWGCSHSMSNLLTFHPTSSAFLASCVTDCYPGTSGSNFATTSKGGLYTENKNKLWDVSGGCNGDVAGELGGAAAAPTGWKLVFNAHQQPTVLGQKTYDTMSMNQDIGFASIAANKTLSGSIVWLTNTPMIQEADSAIVRFQPAGDTSEQYIVGWLESGAYKLARVDGAGKFIEPASDVTAKAKWGQRDDPFRAHVNGDIVWAWADAANATSLKFARLRSGATAECAKF